MTRKSDPPNFRPETDDEKKLVRDFLDARTHQDKFIEILVRLFKDRRWDVVGTCPGGIRQDDLEQIFKELRALGCPGIIDEYVK